MQSAPTPHLQIKVSTQDKLQLINVLSTSEVVLAYQGRWCCFRYTILEGIEESGYIKLAIELVNSFLHHGQFYCGQCVLLYYRGVHIAMAQVEKVLAPCLHYWETLPLEAAQKQPMPMPELMPVISNWVITLSDNNTASLVVDTAATTGPRLIIQNVAHRTLLLTQARQICETLKNATWGCCYKVAYLPPSYGLFELFLKDVSMEFILYSQTHFAKGSITIN